MVHQPLFLLTLGQCIPFVALVPEAKSYRDTVAAVGQDSRLRWHDVTGRIDSLCFHANRREQPVVDLCLAKGLERQTVGRK